MVAIAKMIAGFPDFPAELYSYAACLVYCFSERSFLHRLNDPICAAFASGAPMRPAA